MKILITGATGKIGSELALTLADPKYELILGYNKNFKKAKSLQKRLSNSKIIKADLRKNSDIKKIFKTTPDILIHTAGTFPRGEWGTICKRAFDAAISDNLESTFFLLQEASKKMKKGKIIILTDASINRFYKNFVPYCLAKASIEVLIKGISHLLPKDLKVKTYAPYISGKPSGISNKDWDKIKFKNTTPKIIVKKIIKLI